MNGRILRIAAAAVMALMAPAAVRAAELVIGVTPWAEAAKTEAAMAPIAGYLTQQTGRPTRLFVPSSYKELFRRMQETAVDIGFFSPSAYVDAKQALPTIEYVATALRIDASGQPRPTYTTVLVCLNNAPYKSVEDLLGLTFGFTETTSTSGYRLPMVFFKQRGLDPAKHFGKVLYLKHHDKVFDALLDGSIQAGASFDGMLWEYRAKKGDQFRVISETGRAPLDAVVIAPHLVEAERAPLRQAMLDLKPGTASILEAAAKGFPFAGFEAIGDASYDSLREVKRLLAP